MRYNGLVKCDSLDIWQGGKVSQLAVWPGAVCVCGVEGDDGPTLEGGDGPEVIAADGQLRTVVIRVCHAYLDDRRPQCHQLTSIHRLHRST